MDFEVIDQQHPHPSLRSLLARYLTQTRRQLQDWEAKPPHGLGALMLLLVSLEIVLAWRLTHGLSWSFHIITQTAFLSGLVLLIEFSLARMGREVGEYFKKKGSVATVITFFNFGLMPMLLILPIYLIAYISGQGTGLPFLVALLLSFKVLSNWRESMEIGFEFNRLQSALVLYLSGGLVGIVIMFIFYITVLGAVADFFAKF